MHPSPMINSSNEETPDLFASSLSTNEDRRAKPQTGKKRNCTELLAPKSNVQKTGTWINEEHRRYLEGVKKYGNKWKLISEYVGTRSSIQVRSHNQKMATNQYTKKCQKILQQIGRAHV